MAVKDLGVGITITAKSGEAVAELRRLKGGIDDVKKSAADTAAPTANLGRAAREAAGDLAGMSDDTENATVKSRILSAVSEKLGFDLGTMAGGARGATGALGGATSALGGLARSATVALGVVGALGVGFVTALSLANNYSDSIETLQEKLDLAGNVTGQTAEQFRASAAEIAAATGTSFAQVEEAQVRLVASGKFFGDQIDDITAAGAGYAAKFGLDVVDATDVVAKAMEKLGNGDLKALAEGFGFLDAETRQSIITLIGLGKNVAAQQLLLAVLNETVAGAKGSSTGAFGQLKDATFDYLGALASSFGPIQAAQGLLKDLADSAVKAANEIRQATFAASQPRQSSQVFAEFRASASQAGTTRALAKRSGSGNERQRLEAQAAAEFERTRALALEFNKSVAAEAALIRAPTAASRAKEDAQIAAFEKLRKDRAKKPKGAGGKSEAEREAEKRAREAKAAARELANDLAALTRAYDPLDAAQKKYAETLKTITKLQDASAGASRISAEQAERFNAAALKELDDAKRTELEALTGQYDEAAAAAEKYRETLERIARLEARALGDGGITKQQGDKFREAARAESVEPLIKDITDKLSGASRTGARVLRDEGIASAQAVAKALGGGLGREASDFIGLLRGAKTGDFTSVQGKLGGILTLLSGNKQGEEETGVSKGAAAFGKSIEKAIEKPLDKIFGEGGIFSRSLGSELGTVGETIGTAIAGAAFGKGATSLVGARGSKTGAAIGAVAGKATGIPFGDLVGSVFGSLVGGAFKKAKKGSAAVSFADGGFAAGDAVGNSSSLRGQASALAGSIAGRIETIAETLGGFLSGKGSVSIGSRNGKAVVDTTGGNRTKGAGVVKFGKGEEGQAKAEAFALANLLADGAIDGLSDKVAAALRGSSDIDKAVREAVKVDELEQLLAGFGAGTKKALVDFERQAKDRLRIATKFGFDVVRVEEETAKQRKALNDQLLEERTGSLKALLEDFALGDRSTGSLADRRAGLLAQIKGLEGSAATDASVASKIADLLSQFDAISLEANGTAGGQFAADRAQASDIAQRIIDQATREIEAAAAAARANAGTSTDTLIKTSNATLATIATGIDELGALTSQMVSALGRITANTASANKDDPFAAALAIGGRVI